MVLRVPPAWENLSGAVDYPEPCRTRLQLFGSDMGLQEIFIGGMLLAHGEHLIPRGGVHRHTHTSAAMSGLDGELFSEGE